jgi:hypothetical protein
MRRFFFLHHRDNDHHWPDSEMGRRRLQQRHRVERHPMDRETPDDVLHSL